MNIKQLIGVAAVFCGSVATVQATAFVPPVNLFPGDNIGGVLTFNGEISGVACTHSVNGAGPDATITLQQRRISDFPDVGDTQAWVAIDILVGCATQAVVPPVGTWTRFHGGSVNPGTGRLDNTGTAEGVDLQLTDEMGNPIQIGSDTKAVIGEITLFDDVGITQYDGDGDFPTWVSASLRHGVQYYRHGVVKPGTVVATAHYTVEFD